MFIRKLDPAAFEDEYGVKGRRLYPWPDVVTPPFGSMMTIIAPGKSISRHNHHEAETFLVIRGQGTMTVDDEQAPVASGDVIYTPPYSNHAFLNTSADDDLHVISSWWEDTALLDEVERARAAEPGARRVLVTATPPTVNGDLHLGHLSGPYVAGDVLTRFLRLTGRQAGYVSGADDHQSYVALKAAQTGETPRAVADRFAEAIPQTLAAADVALDVFSRPSHSRHHAQFVQEFFGRLIEKGVIRRQSGKALFGERSGRYLFEAHVSGRCPHCGDGCDGNACETCGRPNDCVDLLEPRAKGDGEPLVVREVERLVLPLEEHRAQLEAFHAAVDMPPHLQALCEAMLADGLPELTLSHPTDWGIPVPGMDGQCFYVWAEMAPGYLAATQELAEGQGLPGWEAYWKDPAAEVVQCFGFDNGWFHAVLFPVLWSAYDAEIRLPSTFVVNEFYLLEGEKFSTSRGHAVWAREFVQQESADRARWYVSRDRPEGRQTSFSRPAYEAALAAGPSGLWMPWLQRLGRDLAADCDGRAPVTGGYSLAQQRFFARLRELEAQLRRAYEPRGFSPPRVERLLHELVVEADAFGHEQQPLAALPGRSSERRTALALQLAAARLLAVAGAPLLPGFAARLLEALGEAPGGPNVWRDEPAFLAGGQDVSGLTTIAF